MLNRVTMTHPHGKIKCEGDGSKVCARKGQPRTRQEVLQVSHGAHHSREGRQEQGRPESPSASMLLITKSDD